MRFGILNHSVSVSTILTWKIPKIQIRCSKSQNKAHFRNLWEKQMQINTHITDITNDTVATDNGDKILDQVLDPR